MNCLEAINAVLSSTLSTSARMVAIVVAMRANGSEGSCYVSIDTFCSQTDLSESTVRRTLRQLTQAGVLSATHRQQETTIYRLSEPGVVAVTRGGSHHDQGGVVTMTPDQTEQDQTIEQTDVRLPPAGGMSGRLPGEESDKGPSGRGTLGPSPPQGGNTQPERGDRSNTAHVDRGTTSPPPPERDGAPVLLSDPAPPRSDARPTPRPTRGRKSSSRSSAGVGADLRPFTDAWSAAWAATYPAIPYPWTLPGPDAHAIRAAAAATGWSPGEVPTAHQIDKLRTASERFISEAAAGRCYGIEVPTVGSFARNVARWLLAATQPAKPLAHASRGVAEHKWEEPLPDEYEQLRQQLEGK